MEQSLQNAWEPVFHFCRQQQIKFRPEAVGHVSEDCFDYSPNNPKSTSGSGLLGTGARGSAASELGAGDSDGRFTGIARPSHVIEVKTESSQGSHSAPFPRALVEFFIKAFTDPGDVIFDPFLGSGTMIAAAHVHDRIGYGVEISPAYCDVVLRRIAHLTGEEPRLTEGGYNYCIYTGNDSSPCVAYAKPGGSRKRRLPAYRAVPALKSSGLTARSPRVMRRIGDRLLFVRL